MKNTKIIAGYKGIMDLDLTNVPEKFHKEMINLHYKDIREYKIEQKRREPKERYEYSVERTTKIHEKDKYHSRQKKIQEELLQQKEDERRNNYLSSLHKIDDNYKNNRIVNN